MYAGCKICGRTTNSKGYSTIGNQKVCSIRCAKSVVAEQSDRCGNCGEPVWEDDYYAVQGTYCCSPKCRDAIKDVQQNDMQNMQNIQNNTPPLKSNLKKKKGPTKKAVVKSKKPNNHFDIEPGMKVGGTNVAVGPRDWESNDFDFGPGDSNVDGNYYHGGYGNNFRKSNQKNNYNNPGNSYGRSNYDDNQQGNNYNTGNYGNDDDDEEDDAYGDINDQNYLNQYGDHQIIQKNKSLAAEQMEGGKIPDSANKPKNESHSVVHHGDDTRCQYCGFVIKDGTQCFVDNYGKKFDTNECFSNFFQGIPRPKFG